MSQRWLLFFLTAAAAGLAQTCNAAIAPNPGGSVVYTNSTTATATYVPNPVTQQVAIFDTTITAMLSGSPVYNMEFALPFTDPTVQAAVAAANAVLAGDGANYGAPVLANSVTSQTTINAPTPPPNLTCAQLFSGAYTSNGFAVATPTLTFGPETISVGDCQQDSFTILPGQLDININADFGYTVPVDVVTTTTLTSQLYQISGLAATTPPSTSVPEPATAGLLFAGLAVLCGIRRRR